MNICLFKPEEIAKPLDIKDERAVHLLKILHKGEGDSFAAGIIGGKAGRATITRLDLHEEKSADGRKSFKKGSISFDFVGESDGSPGNQWYGNFGDLYVPCSTSGMLRDSYS